MTKRHDGRSNLDVRKLQAKAGVIKKADGSAYFKIGNTAAYAAVYGPRELHPKFMQNPRTGILRCSYNMLPFSTTERNRPGPSRRSKELSLVTQKALLPVVDLSEYPNAVVDVFIELSETDAGSRCAGICAAAIALADAGITMKDLVPAVSVGLINNELVVDLDGEEEHMNENETPDVPIAMIPSTGEYTLLQMDGIMTKDQVLEALTLVKPALQEILKVQKQALKDRFSEGEQK
ncbi:MAG: exosome complex exonuclease Rrp41 [Candidatus Woesearchaeota archaeon]|nr:MAG: exosome complex exonuclease Rrp41 [Candidatus Woesearchaeota archaeon]